MILERPCVPACRYQALLPFACYVARRALTGETRERANRLAQIALAVRQEKLWPKQLRDLVAELPNRPRFTWRLFGAGIPFTLALGALVAIPVSTLPDNLSTYIGSTGLVLVAAFVKWARRTAHYANTVYPIIPSLVAGLLLGAAYEGAQVMTQRLYYGTISADQLTAFAVVVLPVAIVALTLAANRGLQLRVPESALLPDGLPDDLTGEINEWFERLREPGYHPSWDAATRVADPIYNQYANLSALGRPAEALATARDEIPLLRQLAQENPDAYTALLAKVLNDCGLLLYINLNVWYEGALHLDREAQARIEEARIITEEAVWIRRSLAARYPKTYEAGLATSLHNLGGYLAMTGHVDEAVTNLSNAIAIRRQLAQADTISTLRDLANSLQLLGQVLSYFANRAELALAPLQEALSIRQGLAELFPTAFQGDLAGSQLSLNGVLDELSQSPQTLRPRREAENILRPPPQGWGIGYEISLVEDVPARRRKRRLGPLKWAAVVIVVAGSVTAWFLSRPVWISGVGTAYVTSDEGIVPINLATGQADSPITIHGIAYGVALSPQGSTAHIVNETTCRNCQGTVGISSLLPVGLTGGPDGKGTFLLQGSSSLGQAFQVVLSPNGKTAYVMTANGVVLVNTTTGEKGATIGIGDAASAIGISPSGRKLYVTASNDKAIYSVNLRTDAIDGPVKLTSSIFAIAPAPSGGSVYVYDAGGIASVNPATASINWEVRSPNLGGGGALGGSLVVTSNGHVAYASGEGVGVVPINLRTHQVGQILLDQAVDSMALSADSKVLYAGCWDGAIYPIKVPTNQVGRPVSAGNEIQSMAITP
jgi:tetratricopeptide (TPR) repeat protein